MAAAVLGTVIILGGVVLGLHEREKVRDPRRAYGKVRTLTQYQKEDEKERRRALHAINFQAL